MTTVGVPVLSLQTTAALVCGDPNVDGMAWDVEPFSNDQVSE